ncbi:hypothetical protein IVA94_14675 [Bradyrhizobium sp. 156]|uniref:hypothetical protein n=1 Tax=Bradyrhizobium sp. 156 TaxID=2782630 RepID=UPI001FF8686A|nr:hypothetical protein [Bradyrhizobium sp. 156]MCK1322113.1 hypothetical protein [Bradyrhizobium sp. 156]
MMLPVIGGAVFLAYAIISTYQDYETRNKPAWTAGFAGADDMDQAKQAGFTDSASWKTEVERRAAARAAEQASVDAARAQVKAADDARKRESNERFQAAVRGALALRERMKNPESFTLERVTRSADGALCYTYRAANSFNAIIPGQAQLSPLKVKGSESFPMLWSDKCKGFQGDEVENVAYALTYYPRK